MGDHFLKVVFDFIHQLYRENSASFFSPMLPQNFASA